MKSSLGSSLIQCCLLSTNDLSVATSWKLVSHYHSNKQRHLSWAVKEAVCQSQSWDCLVAFISNSPGSATHFCQSLFPFVGSYVDPWWCCCLEERKGNGSLPKQLINGCQRGWRPCIAIAKLRQHRRELRKQLKSARNILRIGKDCWLLENEHHCGIYLLILISIRITKQ